MKKTVVLGASPNEDRYSYKAVSALHKHGHPVVAVGVKEGAIGDIKIQIGQPEVENVHTVTLYINPQRQAEQYKYILSLQPQRVIFNPGTENDEFIQILQEKQIQVEQACTLVLLASGQF